MSIKNPDQRVGVFVDVQNLYYSARNIYGARVNFNEILKAAVGNRRLIRAIAYVVQADMPDEHNFFEALEKAGFEVKRKELQTYPGGQQKADWDVGIAMDIIKLMNKLDVVVLCSGDGDFKPLLEYFFGEKRKKDSINCQLYNDLAKKQALTVCFQLIT
jgi:uncharacterized LabA/DUF88 family protein